MGHSLGGTFMNKIMESSQGSIRQGFLLCKSGEVSCLGRLHREDIQERKYMFEKPQVTSKIISDNPGFARRLLFWKFGSASCWPYDPGTCLYDTPELAYPLEHIPQWGPLLTRPFQRPMLQWAPNLPPLPNIKQCPLLYLRLRLQRHSEP